MKRRFLAKIGSLAMAFCFMGVMASQTVLMSGAVNMSPFFQSRRYRNEAKYGDRSMPYRLFIPDDYDATKKYPVVLHLHGEQERGDDNDRPVNRDRNLPQRLMLGEYAVKYPCLIVVPQIPEGDAWVSSFSSPKISEGLSMALSILEEVDEEYPINKGRIYVEGYGDGANGALDLAMRNPNMFAAAVALDMNSEDNLASYAPRLKNTPVQFYQRTSTDATRLQAIRDFAQAVIGQNSKSVYHDVEDQDWNASLEASYTDTDLIPWIFAQVKGKDDTVVPQKPTSSQQPSSSKVSSVASRVSSQPVAPPSSSSQEVSSQEEESSRLLVAPISSDLTSSIVTSSEAENSNSALLGILLIVGSILVLGAGGCIVYILMRKKTDSDVSGDSSAE